MNAQKPFSKLKVLDLSTVLAGPSVGTFFAELGAKVIKIEHPINGDVTQTWRLPNEAPAPAQSAYYSSVNYNKEKRYLDFKNPEHYARLLEELVNTDIVLMNFKKGDDLKFGLDHNSLWKHKPDLIIGKISGFGADQDRVAYDLILQAETGFMSMNGTPESGPVKMPVALIDVLAAHQLKEGLLLALLNRKTEGQVVSVSLYDAAVCSLANQAANFLMAQQVAQRIGSLHPNIAPYGEIFTTKDAKNITFAIGSQTHFEKLCRTLNLDSLIANPAFQNNVNRVQNRTELATLLSKAVQTHDATELCQQLIELGVPVAEIKSLDQVFENPAAQALILTEEVNGQNTQRVQQVAFKITR
ncbi:MAG: hypothetical protein RLZZ65_232 [Bacteroidota bacterium]|jgi:crotonobetainyl-CoA:carnitine CoA-transferase CaiB-like acyl-CoA transferase